MTVTSDPAAEMTAILRRYVNDDTSLEARTIDRVAHRLSPPDAIRVGDLSESLGAEAVTEVMAELKILPKTAPEVLDAQSDELERLMQPYADGTLPMLQEVINRMPTAEATRAEELVTALMEADAKFRFGRVMAALGIRP